MDFCVDDSLALSRNIRLMESSQDTPNQAPGPEYSDEVKRGEHLSADGLVHPEGDAIPVVGMGGSAGSIGAIQKFLSDVSEDSGAAYVVVIHLSPEHESVLPDLLRKSTSLPVVTVGENVVMQSDHVYVISPGKQLSIADGTLQSFELNRPKGRHVTIDLFFRTLAEAHGVNACAIVFSGGDGDGAIGLKRIKERGGLTIAQDPSEAEHDSIPRAAISTGMVDWILPAAEMPGRLREYWANGRELDLPAADEPPTTASVKKTTEEDEASLLEILAYLDARTNHDFSSYKRATVLRRVGRRMQVNGAKTLATYLSYLRVHPGETGALLQDLLISVTNFFRDKEAFTALEYMIPELFKNKTASDQIRIWVPACATGEEAYSLAILLCEHADKMTHPPAIQIFATDLDQVAIDVAREGRYPQTIAADLTEERMRRYFTREADGFRVNRIIRESVLFALHDLLKDAPFSRLDLVCCRNLLIYLNRKAQDDVFETFHFSLRPKGKLFLGSSETVEETSGLFTPLDKTHRIFARLDAQRIGLHVPSGRTNPAFGFGGHDSGFSAMIRRQNHDEEAGLSVPQRLPDAAALHLSLLERSSPPSIVINRNHDVIHLSKNAGNYLQFTGGEPSTNLLKLIRPELRTTLRTLLYKAQGASAVVESRNLPVQSEGKVKAIDISVELMEESSTDFFLIIINEHPGDTQEEMAIPVVTEGEQSIVRHLEEELDQFRSTWRERVEQHEATVEELKASNEELQAMNEELRSATEEMETGREELQSINEEIITINQELKGKVEELGRANSDLHNLMSATRIATIFLDWDLRIKRFTPTTTGLFNFRASDQGRPLSDFTHNLQYPEITNDAARVLQDLGMAEREVRATDGGWYLVRMSPYKTTENLVAGVVITCIDITERKKNEDSMRWLSAIVESSSDAIVSFRTDGAIASWNKGAEEMFGYAAEEIVGKPFSQLNPSEPGTEQEGLFSRLSVGKSSRPFETVGVRKDGTQIDVSLSASVMRDVAGMVVGGTAIARDITDRKKAVRDLKDAHDDLEEKVKERTAELQGRVEEIAAMASQMNYTEERERKRMARILHDELQQVLVSAKMRIESLESLEDAKRVDEIGGLAAIMDELIANSRSLAVELSPPVLSENLGHALEWLCHTWMPDKYDLKVESRIDLSLDTKREDARGLVFHAVKELLFNVVKHSESNEAEVELVSDGAGDLKVTVRDHGLGFDVDAKAAGTKPSGFGLASLRKRFDMLGGRFELKIHKGNGVEAVIIVPRNLPPDS